MSFCSQRGWLPTMQIPCIPCISLSDLVWSLPPGEGSAYRGRPPPLPIHLILRDTVNKPAIRILLEYILAHLLYSITQKRNSITSMMTGQVNSVWIGAHDKDNDNSIRYLESGDVIPNSSLLWISWEPTHSYITGNNTYRLDCVYMDGSGKYRLVLCDIQDYFVCEV